MNRLRKLIMTMKENKTKLGIDLIFKTKNKSVKKIIIFRMIKVLINNKKLRKTI